jgi:hypothetical protein
MNDEILSTLTSILDKQTAIMEATLAATEKASAPAHDYFKGSVERNQAPPHMKELLGLVKSKDKAAANFQTATPLHGAGGIFSTPGLDRTVVTAYIRAGGSIASVLSKVPSVDESPRFATLTGYTATSGTEPTNACEDAPTGYVKGCNLTARFGLIRRDTQTIEMDKVMLRINRSDFKDLVLAGEVLGLTDLVPSGLNQSQILNVVTMSEMVVAGVNAERKFVQDIWQGTVAAGTFPGLDVQITTGHIDADTGTACPAVDSDVKSFNFNNVDGTDTLDIVRYLSMIEYYLYYNAEKMGLLPVKWVIVMRDQLWHELSAVWPIIYNTDRSASVPAAGVTLFLDGREVTAERDRMRGARTLAINGRTLEVVTDSGIYEHNNANNGNLGAGEYASSIYFVPLTIGGNIPATFIEYVDYRQSQPDTAQLAAFPGAPDYFWTDNGMYSWAVDQNRWCYQLSLKIEPRIVLRTPHLAGRLDYCKYIPLQHLRENDPTSPYNADGGVSFRTPTAAQAVWA